MVRALELARLDSNRAYINALARFLPSSTRLESKVARLNSNLNLQLDELDRAIQVPYIREKKDNFLQINSIKFLQTFLLVNYLSRCLLPSTYRAAYSSYYKGGDIAFYDQPKQGCFLQGHFFPGSTRLSSIRAWLDSTRSIFYWSLARLDSAREASGSTQLNSRNCWLEPSLNDTDIISVIP